LMLWRFSAVLLIETIMLWGTFFRNFRNFFSFYFFPFYNKNKTIDNNYLLRLINKTSLRNKPDDRRAEFVIGRTTSGRRHHGATSYLSILSYFDLKIIFSNYIIK
jgi:hypothetical protein